MNSNAENIELFNQYYTFCLKSRLNHIIEPSMVLTEEETITYKRKLFNRKITVLQGYFRHSGLYSKIFSFTRFKMKCIFKDNKLIDIKIIDVKDKFVLMRLNDEKDIRQFEMERKLAKN